MFTVCFKVFDIDRDGILNQNEIKDMIDILIFVARESSNSNQFKQITNLQAMADLYVRINKTSQLSAVNSGDIIELFSVTQEEFMMWTVQSTLNLVQPFLDLLFEVCHIVLGLRPQCRHLEHDIGRPNMRGKCVNDLCLISFVFCSKRMVGP